jgi:subfamily B ATP-binding cassette protein MsbA
MKSYFRILGFGSPYTSDIPRYFVFAMFATIFGLLNFTLLIPFLSLMFETGQATEKTMVKQLPEFYFGIEYFKDVFNFYFNQILVTEGKEGALKFVCSIIIVSVLVSNISRYIAQRTIGDIKARVVKNLRRSVYNRLLDFELGFFTNEKKGDMMARVTSDVQEIEISVIDTFSTFLRDPIIIISYFVALFFISTELTQFVILYLPISFFLLAEITKRIKRSARMSQGYLGEILGVVDETMSGIRIIKGFVAEKFMRNRFEKINDNYANVYRSMAYKREFSSPLSEFLGVSLVTGMLLYGGLLIIRGNSDLSPEEFLPYIFILVQILVPIKSVTNSFSQIQRGLVAGDRIFQLLDRKIQVSEVAKPIELKDFNSTIEYSNVSFAYESDLVLSDVNLSISKGQTIALVGPSGGGKSTLADLLPRFYDPVSGEIKIDGIPIQHISFASLRKQMGIVTQESILFNDTVFNNIAFGIPNARQEDVEHAAKIANAHDFILKTEDGYQTIIGERGMKLSGGQRQRISIARAVLKNPPILILDEATSALDNESEKLVQEALTNLMKNRTSIVIAHRLSTIQHADEIVVIEKGKIVERGNHEILINAGGLYSKLHKLIAE